MYFFLLFNKNIFSFFNKQCIVIRYKVYNEHYPRAGLNIQQVIYEQLARASQNS